MLQTPIYMDNHATTRVDPRVVDAMLPFFTRVYGNAGSTSHSFGWEAKSALDDARGRIAAAIGAGEREIVFTSGATESNNLAIRGVAERVRRRGNHIVSVITEHKAVLDPLKKLARKGFEVSLLPVEQVGSPTAGRLNLDTLQTALRDDTCLVSVMLANNEIGVLQPIAAIGSICRERGIPLHCDATQAVGKIPVNVDSLNIDLMSFTAHKLYGPKGIGALYVRRGTRLEAQIDGGGQEHGLRSGTLPVASIIGFAAALDLCLAEMPTEATRLYELRERLYSQLRQALPDLVLNGPVWSADENLRLPGNLNGAFPFVQGEALMMSMRDVAVSSGSACTSANPEPSHVLRAIGQTEDLTLASLRFGLGRFNTTAEVDFAAQLVIDNVRRLRALSSMA
ncbi:cysteine desulfurase family protein [Anatilimnocola sp. NA78]|uniref:cysteine desulfurase family protein n=1 Tax=Anatilimnocola sp. NA78 TaxID=3415683 RepID=UPI003CE46609